RQRDPRSARLDHRHAPPRRVHAPRRHVQARLALRGAHARHRAGQARDHRAREERSKSVGARLRKLLPAVLVCVALATAHAVTTRTWRLTNYKDFEEGEAT